LDNNILNSILSLLDQRYIIGSIIKSERLSLSEDQRNITVQLKPSSFRSSTSKAILCKVSDSHVTIQRSGESIDINEISKFGQLLNDEMSRLFNFDVFGCCSQYLRCSDAISCTHEDLFFASGCMYKKHLEAGRIFYGNNRNID